MGFDPLLQLVVDRAQRQIVLEVFESGFHFRQLDVKLPQLFGRSSAGNVGAQQVAAFPCARLPQFVFAQGEGQGGLAGRSPAVVNQARRRWIIVQGRAQLS